MMELANAYSPGGIGVWQQAIAPPPTSGSAVRMTQLANALLPSTSNPCLFSVRNPDVPK
jgi:hypothetical protein